MASGSHACTLHWKHNDGAIRKGDLLLLDAGIEGNSLYTADITRTLPISGKFTPEQRAIYEIVLEAQRAALELVKPGNDFMAPNQAAMAVLAHGLERLRILTVSAPRRCVRRTSSIAAIRCTTSATCSDSTCMTARRHAPRITSTASSQAGMVLTVEPGLYFQTDDLTVPTKYRGIGVRIEDDVLVTAKGHRVLSSSLPSDPDEVEKWMKQIWKRR